MDAWRGEYAKADTMLKDVNDSIVSNMATGGRSTPAKQKVKRLLRTLDKSLASLRKTLGGLQDRQSALGLVPADLREANDHLRTLESGIASAKKRSASTATPMRSERDSLMSGRSDGTYGAGAAAAAAAPEMTSSEMRQQQELQVRQQDESFAALEEGLDTLGESAKGISAELGHQDVIIEDVSDKMRKADDSLRARSRAIVRIMQANNVCWMYITIFVLLALLVVLTATGSF